MDLDPKSLTALLGITSIVVAVAYRFMPRSTDRLRRDRIDQLASDIETANLDADTRSTVEEELEAARERQDALRAQEADAVVGVEEVEERRRFGDVRELRRPAGATHVRCGRPGSRR